MASLSRLRSARDAVEFAFDGGLLNGFAWAASTEQREEQSKLVWAAVAETRVQTTATLGTAVLATRWYVKLCLLRWRRMAAVRQSAWESGPRFTRQISH